MKPTKKQIQSQIRWLTKNKERVLHYSGFGDNHHASIDAQLLVLKENLDEDDIYDISDEESWADNVRDSAIEARQWLDGIESISPSTNWEPLLNK